MNRLTSELAMLVKGEDLHRKMGRPGLPPGSRHGNRPVTVTGSKEVILSGWGRQAFQDQGGLMKCLECSDQAEHWR